MTAGIVAAAVLGIVVIAALWWAYFDVYAVGAQRRSQMRRREPARASHATTTATSTCR